MSDPDPSGQAGHSAEREVSMRPDDRLLIFMSGGGAAILLLATAYMVGQWLVS